MKTKQELLKAYDEWVTQGEQIKAQLDALPDDPKPVGRWKPENGDEYWFITGSTILLSDTCKYSTADNNRCAIGNFYRTKEEAQTALDQQLATVRVLDRIAELNAEQGWVCDWSDDDDKYYVGFDHGENKLNWACRQSYQFLPTSHYGSQHTIETVIAEMGEDCLKMLGVSGVSDA